MQDVSRSVSFPYETLAVNVLESLVIGVFFFFIKSRGAMAPNTRALVLIGMLGAFTTSSTFSLETLNLILDGELTLALANLGANGLWGLLAVWGGRMLPVLIWR